MIHIYCAKYDKLAINFENNSKFKDGMFVVFCNTNSVTNIAHYLNINSPIFKHNEFCKKCLNSYNNLIFI